MKFYNDIITVSRKQVELAICIRQYRRIHDLSQKQMAKICSIYAEPYGVKFANTEISNYENYRIRPSAKKFQILMSAMDIDKI